MTKTKHIRNYRVGDYLSWGTGYKVYTIKGWVIVDNKRELDEELRECESLLSRAA